MSAVLRLSLAALLLASASLPQDASEQETAAPVLRYMGSPLQLAFECTGQDIGDFGMRCTTGDPCPIYLDITSVRGVGPLVYLAGNFHNGSSTMASFLLRSDDGGQSWTEPHERIRGAGIDMVYFQDETSGWAAGHRLSVPPRDPFFLITTDGGKHWRHRNVFEETGVGLIEEFWFDDATAGGLLLDRVYPEEAGGRYERYETMTGGANWSIREVSATPIRIRNRIPVSADEHWRVEPDRDTGSWLVKQRQPAGWATVAAFLIQTASCVPSAVAALPAPPDADEPSPAEGALPEAPGGVFVIGAPTPRTQQPPKPPPDPNQP